VSTNQVFVSFPVQPSSDKGGESDDKYKYLDILGIKLAAQGVSVALEVRGSTFDEMAELYATSGTNLADEYKVLEPVLQSEALERVGFGAADVTAGVSSAILGVRARLGIDTAPRLARAI
jgi:hypothetical protein